MKFERIFEQNPIVKSRRFFSFVQILSRELERTSQIFQSSGERQSTLNGTCAIAAGFLVYLGGFTYGFRRLMLTVHWIKSIRDRGMTILFDQISSVKGRIINWQLHQISPDETNVSLLRRLSNEIKDCLDE